MSVPATAKLNLPDKLKERYLHQPGMLTIAKAKNQLGLEEMIYLCGRTDLPDLQHLNMAVATVAACLTKMGVLGGTEDLEGCKDCKLSGAITMLVQLARSFGFTIWALRKANRLCAFSEEVENIIGGLEVAHVVTNTNSEDIVKLCN